MTKQYLVVANWKMYMGLQEETDFVKEFSEKLVKLSTNKTKLILCPSFISAYQINRIFDNTSVQVGAQDCSSHNKGSFTGQTPAKSLHQAGCAYCIIGHSETRYKETEETIRNKMIHLIDYNISPIICIGEKVKTEDSISVIKKQLEEIFKTLKSAIIVPNYLNICIAYEPIWSIGTGEIPSKDHLDTIFEWLKKECLTINKDINWRLLYGGSVNNKTITTVKLINAIDGFLIGKASIDFNQLESIINSLTN